MWVRLPPRAPFFVVSFHLVDASLRRLCLFCTRHFRSNDGIIGPCSLHIGLKLLLARANPPAEKAEKSCLIARSLQCKVVLFPAVKIEEELLVPARV